MHGRVLRRLQWAGMLLICGLFLLAVAVHILPVGKTSLPLFINRSSSMPMGFYHMTKELDLNRGDLLRTCLPDVLNQIAVDRGYLHRGRCVGGATRIGKPVVALQGDTVVVSDKKIEVKSYGEFHVAVYLRDRKGRVLANAIGTHVLKPGECFFLSTYSRYSYDSRYFGPVPCGPSPYETLTAYGFRAP